jgi:hypothetical protein
VHRDSDDRVVDVRLDQVDVLTERSIAKDLLRAGVEGASRNVRLWISAAVCVYHVHLGRATGK